MIAKRFFKTRLLLLLLAVPARAQDSAEPDTAIATRIREILGELEGYQDVTVTVSSGIATLRGETADAALQEHLNELVSRVDGVVAIQNQVVQTTDIAQRPDPAVSHFAPRARQLIALLNLLAVALLVFGLITAAGFWLARRKQPWERLAPRRTPRSRSRS